MVDEELWIFGYGSIVWKVDFPYVEKNAAFIRGWSRRFWQGSTDHRGVPQKPGRVVTLVENATEICWGMAYRIDDTKKLEVLDHLDHRERGGYDRLSIAMNLADNRQATGITYFATGENPNFLGETDSLSIAQQIHSATGPSGKNTEYVYRLEQSLNALNVPDPHVTEIAQLVRKLESENEK